MRPVARLRAPRRGVVELALRGDSAADIRQWFSFRVSSPVPRELRIVDVAQALITASDLLGGGL